MHIEVIDGVEQHFNILVGGHHNELLHLLAPNHIGYFIKSVNRQIDVLYSIFARHIHIAHHMVAVRLPHLVHFLHKGKCCSAGTHHQGVEPPNASFDFPGGDRGDYQPACVGEHKQQAHQHHENLIVVAPIIGHHIINQGDEKHNRRID